MDFPHFTQSRKDDATDCEGSGQVPREMRQLPSTEARWLRV